MPQAFFRTSFSKSQVTGALRLTDSFTMWATAAAWWPRRPSSTTGLRVRTDPKKRAMWMKVESGPTSDQDEAPPRAGLDDPA